MSGLIIFEDHAFGGLLPLTYWRSACELRCGRARLMDHAMEWSGSDAAALWVRSALRDLVARRTGAAVNEPARPGTLLLNGRWLPEGDVQEAVPPAVGMLGDDIAFVACDERLARRLDSGVAIDDQQLKDALDGVPRLPALGRMVAWPWDLLECGAEMLHARWRQTDAGVAGDIDDRACILHPRRTHVGAGTIIQPGVVLDAEQGPIFIDQDVRIRPNAVIEGPTYIGPGSQINAGAWIRNNVVIGPQCRIGGEVGASVFQGFANKQHHGFVGHSCLAEWVNLGAGTTTSNLKNTYGSISVPIAGLPVDSGRMFMGAVIGDFSRTGINQSLTTGSVIGMASSVVTTGTAPQFVPSFRFLTDRKNDPYDRARCLDVAVKIMSRRQIRMSAEERAYLLQLPEICMAHETI